ncbi:DNA ligase D, 3'-phosphoesterase domain-containing protein [Jatrophihabitans endophyticus]|uniref:DNA ligase D, 3'-phosphoesterase domain-containing protein n=1 Tax=Jatrophihabitans endophyticus TaxID=1206085 RepID=A0A1M5DXW0_9ACTN|nr:DNA polymerase ligase N-terminal domain-containing protein [Jatrophihabitans endophyticus]SHF71837.1 DNA ligase D, 3'-phosphoesterase domain-containing protein [Jatrophihabitans endophyticus]
MAEPDDPRFVVQHHLATADHYDLRLEIDGVLVSWAVPKGPSTDPAVRRLARRVGDHALEYCEYEGVLSPQRRGGGVVQVWDHGTFRNVSRDGSDPVSAGAALARGHLSFVLRGEKLRGGYSLLRTRGDDLWLLLKKRDGEADARRDVTGTETWSVLTGRTMAEIEAAG